MQRHHGLLLPLWKKRRPFRNVSKPSHRCWTSVLFTRVSHNPIILREGVDQKQAAPRPRERRKHDNAAEHHLTCHSARHALLWKCLSLAPNTKVSNRGTASSGDGGTYWYILCTSYCIVRNMACMEPNSPSSPSDHGPWAKAPEGPFQDRQIIVAQPVWVG